jgi:hypothetical protein
MYPQGGQEGVERPGLRLGAGRAVGAGLGHVGEGQEEEAAFILPDLVGVAE